MPLSLEEYQEVTEFLKDVTAAYNHLTDWEKEFVTGLRARHVRYNVNLILSEKQLFIIRRIASQKVYAAGQEAMPPPSNFRPLSKYQKEDVMEIIKCAEVADTLTPWEITFLSGIGQLLTTFEEATRLTRKQLATVYLIRERRLQNKSSNLPKKSLDPEGDAVLNSLRTLQNRRLNRDNE